MRAKAAVVVLVGLAIAIALVATPASANLSGAVWTTTINGDKVNANHYNQKCPPGWPPGDPAYEAPPPLVPYLNGGPQFAHAGSWMPPGEYYFQVTDPSGKVLLSDDPVNERFFRIYKDLAGKSWIEYPAAGHVYTQPHHWGMDEYTGVVTIALCPFLDTPNNGGVYKLWVTSVAKYDEANPHARFGFIPKESKTDNFKVKQPELATVVGRKVDTDEPANGLVGLHIILSQLQGKGSHATWVRIADTVTGADGWFSFSNLSVGQYQVCEDLAGTDNPSPDVIDDVVDYSSYTPVGPTCIGFNVARGDLGKKGKNPTPGAVIELEYFVNEEEGEHFAALAGVKFLDVNGNGLLDPDPAEIPLADWGIALEEKVSDGVWRQARRDVDGTPVLVEPQVTGITGAYNFGNLDVDKVYRVCEYKWVDDGDGVLEYTYDDTTYTFGGELVAPDVAGWLQTAPNTGSSPVQLWPDGSYVVVTPGTAPVNVYAQDGCYLVEMSATTEVLTEVAELRFGNKLGSICVQKLQSADCIGGRPLEGWKFNLFTDEACTVPAVDGFGVQAPEITTGADGKACWDDLLGGTYWIKETAANGWVPVAPASGKQMVTLAPGEDKDDPPVSFCNRAICIGLTPGFWKNWRNHYTEAQFLVLLEGTIADGSIAAADEIFEPWPNYPGNEVDHVAAFLLACQLTVNLTQQPGFPNPSGGSLVPECVLPGVEEDLGYWMAEGVAIWNAGGVGYTREYMTLVATILDSFCNANLP